MNLIFPIDTDASPVYEVILSIFNLFCFFPKGIESKQIFPTGTFFI